MIRRCLPLAGALALLATAAVSGQQPPAIPAAADGACRATADPAAVRLFTLLQNQTRTGADPATLNKLVGLLGDAAYERRERAARDLVAVGRPALERLRQARQDPDPEVNHRAQMCIDAINSSLDKNTGYQAVLTLLRQRPAGTAAVLLSYLPDADADTAEEIWQGMSAVAVRDGRLDPACRAALADKAPARRALAAFLVGRYGPESDCAAVRNLLADADPEVRLRAAQGLLAVHDPAAVPALVGLLPDAPLDLAWQAEELLHFLAGGQAPETTIGAGDAAARSKACATWQAWWRTSAAGFDRARTERDQRRPGLILVCEPSRVWLGGSDGKARWEIKELQGPNSIQVLPGPRFLIVEPNAPRVTERDPAGKIVWQTLKLPDDQFVSAQRLANGNTFVACESLLLEYGADGKQLAQVDVNENAINGNGLDIYVGDAVKQRTGSVIVSTNNGVAELDGLSGAFVRGGVVENYRRTYQCRMSVLPDGHCLLTDMRRQRVVETDLAGTICWQHTCTGAVSADGLRNGNILVGVWRDNRIYELTRDGKMVWEVFPSAPPTRVRDAFARVRLGFDGPRSQGFDLNSVANRARALADKNPLLRRRAATALGLYGPEAKAAIPELIAALADREGDVRDRVIQTLIRVGPDALPALLKALHHDAPLVRSGTWQVVVGMGPAARPLLPDVVAVLRDPKEDADGRQAAAGAVAAMGLEGKVAIPALLEVLKGTDDAVRSAAALALSVVGTENADVVAALAVALKDAKYPLGEVGAAQALRNLGPAAVKALPDLLGVLQNRTYPVEVRCAAVGSFAGMGAGVKPAVERLIDVLKDGSQPEKLRIAVAQTLAGLGTEARPALDALGAILRDVNLPSALSVECTNTVAALGPEGFPALIQLVNEGNPKARLTAISHLHNWGNGGKVATPALPALPALLEAAAQDADPEVRKNAAAAAAVIQAGGQGLRRKVMIENIQP